MQHEHHQCHEHEQLPKLNRRLKITLSLFLIVFTLSFLPTLSPLNSSLIAYFKMVWWAILLGLIFGGVIDYFVPDGFVYNLLGQKSARSIFNAVVAGFFLSACSHGILAIAIELHKKGASTASVIAFLLASPWANLPVTLMLFGFFGWQALLLVAAAMIIASSTGFIYLLLERLELIEGSPEPASDQSHSWDRVREFNFTASIKGIYQGSVRLANMVLWWILIGFMLAAFIGAYVPSHVFMDYFGPTMSGLLLTLLVATVIEVCSEGSAPIAFEIYNQVGALGNPFVFLMAGVVTDYTEIGLLWSSIGKKTAMFLPLVTIPQVILFAYLFNLL